jgi:hypothetical protein
MERRFSFLGFELYWSLNRQGKLKVMRRTAPKRLQRACRRIKEWIKEHRHLPGREFIAALNRRLRGHYNYYGVIGNTEALNRFYRWATSCAFKWLNRRGGKRRSFTWEQFHVALEKLGIAKPQITESNNQQHRVFA